MDSDTDLEVVREALGYYNKINHSPLCVSDGTSSTSSLEGNSNETSTIIIMYDTEPEENDVRQNSTPLQQFDRCDITFSEPHVVAEHRSSKKSQSGNTEMTSQTIEHQKSMLQQSDEKEHSTENRGNSEQEESKSELLSGVLSKSQNQVDEKESANLRGSGPEKGRFQYKRSGDEVSLEIPMGAADDCKAASSDARKDDEAMEVGSPSGYKSADGTRTQEQLYFASRRVAKRASRGCVMLCCVALCRAALCCQALPM